MTVISNTGGLLGRPIPPQPAGENHQAMRVIANISDGIPVGFSTNRAVDITGAHPAWFEFQVNEGDIDNPVEGPIMGPRHRHI